VTLQVTKVREAELMSVLGSFGVSMGKYVAIFVSMTADADGSEFEFSGANTTARFADNGAVTDWVFWLPDKASKDEGAVVTAKPMWFTREFEVVGSKTDLDKSGKLLVSGSNMILDLRPTPVSLDSKHAWYNSDTDQVGNPRQKDTAQYAKISFRFPRKNDAVSGVLLFPLGQHSLPDLRSLEFSSFGAVPLAVSDRQSSRVATSSSPAAPDLADVRLTGIVPGDDPIAVLRRGEERYFLHRGDMLTDGWHLAEIGPSSVTLEKGDDRVTLALTQ